MQRDFHHAVTYMTARVAGFSDADAAVIAYAAQYVDDATISGAVHFTNGALYTRISSAHQNLDRINLNNVENYAVWLPFHFLPGNGGRRAAEPPPSGKFINRLVCLPDSPPAQDMVAAALALRGQVGALHRLGITLHVYADTWAHQGFAGVVHDVNAVEDANESGPSGVLGSLKAFLYDLVDDAIPSLGHGRAGVLPDLPFLSWNYKNGVRRGRYERNNTELFCAAANALCRTMQQYLGVTEPSGLGAADAAVMRELFVTLNDRDEVVRHAGWRQALATGRFSFGPAKISYAADGKGSWKAAALGTSQDLPVYEYRDGFLQSDWKLFHDALQEHRLTVLHEILPKYGICAG